MCGIVGILPPHPPGDTEKYRHCLIAMTNMVRHRGPDQQDVWTDGTAFLGATRLAIQGIGTAGDQPMGDSSNRVRVVFNGEIYNHRELRRELEVCGHVFRGNSDTEVIVHGFLEWGTGLLNKLRGMFALCIWDRNRQKMILARDRTGKKPLFFSEQHGTLICASEIKAILNWPGIRRQPDLEAIHHFLSFQYVPGALTAFEGIFRLAPGHMIEVQPGGVIRPVAFAGLPAPTDARHNSASDAREELVALLDNAVRVRMSADVPVGALLSGGLDSSAVVAFMRRHAATGTIKTFSLGFAEQTHDERQYAATVARHFETEHHDMEMSGDLTGLLEKVSWYFDEPFADASALPTMCVAALARQHVAVVLTGDGGDEAFLGYRRYAACHDDEWIRKLPRSLRRTAAALASALPKDGEGTRVRRALGRLLARIGDRESRRYAGSMASFQDHHKQSGYGDALAPYLNSSSFDRLNRYFDNAPTILSGAAWADINTYLPDDLLVKTDIATMANGLEARSPFLDQELFDWALRLPENVRYSASRTKDLLKAAVAPMLPDAIIARPKKGFGIPLQQWLSGDLLPLARELLLSQQTLDRRLVRREFAEKLLSDHCSGRFFHHPRIWALMMLELWFRTWIDPAKIPQSPPH
ncbi:MAG: asparagine synthase (glutamine-hydrolyzing) [Alphaproteobacteria bacterium]